MGYVWLTTANGIVSARQRTESERYRAMFEGMWGRERRQPVHYTKNYSCCAAPGMKCAEITVIRKNSVVLSTKRPGCSQSSCSLCLEHRDYDFMRPAFQTLKPLSPLSATFRRRKVGRQRRCF